MVSKNSVTKNVFKETPERYLCPLYPVWLTLPVLSSINSSHTYNLHHKRAIKFKIYRWHLFILTHWFWQSFMTFALNRTIVHRKYLKTLTHFRREFPTTPISHSRFFSVLLYIIRSTPCYRQNALMTKQFCEIKFSNYKNCLPFILNTMCKTYSITCYPHFCRPYLNFI